MQIDRFRLKKKKIRARAILAGTRSKISTYLLEKGYSSTQVTTLDNRLQKCTSREQIFKVIKAALEKRVWPEPVVYNVLMEIPEETSLVEQHEVEYEEEVERPIDPEDPDSKTEVVTVTKTETEYLLGDDLALEIAELYTRWPADDTPGCVRDTGKKLLHCHMKTAVKDVETYLRVLFHTHDLKWTLVHIQTFHGVVPVTKVDPETGEKVVVGHIAKVLYSRPARIAPYLEPRYEDGAETIELKKDISWLHVYQGQAPWRLA